MLSNYTMFTERGALNPVHKRSDATVKCCRKLHDMTIKGASGQLVNLLTSLKAGRVKVVEERLRASNKRLDFI